MLCDSSKAAHCAESATAKQPLDQHHDECLTQNILISNIVCIRPTSPVKNELVTEELPPNTNTAACTSQTGCPGAFPLKLAGLLRLMPHSSIWHKPSAANPPLCHSSAVFTLTPHVPAELTQKALTFSWEFPLVPQQLHQPLRCTSSQAAGAGQSWVLSPAPLTEPVLFSPVTFWHHNLCLCVMIFPNNKMLGCAIWRHWSSERNVFYSCRRRDEIFCNQLIIIK